MMKTGRPAYRPGNLEEIRFDNRVRSEFGFHLKSYDPKAGTLTVFAQEEELKCDRTQIGLKIEVVLGERAYEMFPGLRTISIEFHPAPVTHTWEFRSSQDPSAQENER